MSQWLAEARALDAADPLAGYRERFDLPEGVIYLDGNSLGALPKAAAARIDEVVRREWGEGLVTSWNAAGWIEAPLRVGAKIAPLVGAGADEVIACDSTSVNLFKLIAAALAMQAPKNRGGRKVVLSEPGNFPTDLYMIAGLEAQGLAERLLAPADQLAEALDDSVAVLLLAHVHYKTGAVHDMAALTRAAHAAGALVLWDLSHSAGAVPVDLNGCEADLAVGCGYKYFNGGPGAPAWAYVARRHQAALSQPLTGWMGHAAPFAFVDDYAPAPGIARLLTGTPPIPGLAMVEAGVELIAEIGIERLVAKSRALGAFFGRAVAELCPGLECVSPPDPAQRGSQLSYRHREAYALTQALIARGVIGDFRDPDVIRFGFAPAYVSFGDCARAALALAEVLESGGWDSAAFKTRAAVT